MMIKAVLNGYVRCALGVSFDDEGQPLNDGRDIDDLPAETLAQMRSDVADFVNSNLPDLHRSALDYEQMGQDLWLTRNDHGTGFWDRDLGRVGERLTAACRAMGGADLYLGEDELVYQH
jgi:hypothetical protein